MSALLQTQLDAQPTLSSNDFMDIINTPPAVSTMTDMSQDPVQPKLVVGSNDTHNTATNKSATNNSTNGLPTRNSTVSRRNRNSLPSLKKTVPASVALLTKPLKNSTMTGGARRRRRHRSKSRRSRKL